LYQAPLNGIRHRTHDNARAKTVIGLLTAEVSHHGGPCFCFDGVEHAALECVAWFNTVRMLEPLSKNPPAAYGARCYAAFATGFTDSILK
jgi:putative transposase